MPFFSICIPAYKRGELLARLLDSIRSQQFRDFEVIVTDDSPDDSVQKVCEKFSGDFTLRYFKNNPALGTPENWNEAIRHAGGQWIKIMHDDDWLAAPDSLEEYKNLIEQNPQASFLFSASTIVKEDGTTEHFETSEGNRRLLIKDPANLFYKNFIGPPSVVLYQADPEIIYDRNMKWLVDVDFYYRYLSRYPNFAMTRKALVKVGFNPGQVTNAVIHDPYIVIPETLLWLQKTGIHIFRRVRNYDAAWRLMRNYRIRSLEQLEELKPPGFTGKIPAVFPQILSKQRHIPIEVLRMGVLSKFFMFISYLGYCVQAKTNQP